MSALASLSCQCPRQELVVALQSADAIAPSSNAAPLLSNLQLTLTEHELEIAATDQQVGLRALLRRVESEQVGTIITPAKQLVNVLKESTSPAVKLSVEGGDENRQLLVTLADGEYRLPIIANQAFPAVSGYPESGAQDLRMPAEELDIMIRRTAFAMDRDRSSAVLGGICLQAREDELVLVATDGKVLSESRLPRQSEGAELSAIIPAATVSHLQRIIGSGEGQVDIAISDKLIHVRTVLHREDDGAQPIQIELSSRLIEGNFPAYRNAIPAQPEHTVRFRTAELASAVRRTALMTSSGNRGIILEIENGSCLLSNLIRTAGSARIPISCEYEGPAQRLGLNAQYMGDVLRAYNADDITLELNGPGRGLLIHSEGQTFLIMPITLPGA